MIVIDEIGYAEQIVKREKFSKEKMADMILTARYLRCIKNLTDDQIVRWLKACLTRSDVKYLRNRRAWNDRVEQALTISKKRDPYTIKSIPIYEVEMNTIASLNDKSLERLMFGILVYSKNKYLKTGKDFVTLDFKELFGTCRIPCTKGERYGLINALIQKGMLEYAAYEQLAVRPTFSVYDSNERIAAYISDSRELGYQYKTIQYFDDRYTKCLRCGKMIKQNANHTRSYCSDCADMKIDGDQGGMLQEIVNSLG